MEIDTKNLIKDITLLEELLNKYEDNNNEVFSELYKIREYYSGEDATYFNNKINTENNNYLILLDILKRISNFYKDVYNLYDNISITKGDSNV